MKFSAIMLFTGLWLTFVYLPIAHMVWFSEGYLFKLGALDFAGGTVVHINSGIAGLVGALLVGKRMGYGRDLLAPHSLTLTFVGACLLWVGWFGFNAGSNLEATGGAALALLNTIVAPAAAGLAWMTCRGLLQGQAVAARHRLRRGGGSRGDHAGSRAFGSRWARSCSASSWAWSASMR